MRPARPVPITMKVSDLGGDSLCLRCPECGWFTQMIDRYLERRFPPGMLMVAVVAKHCCKRCSTAARKVRPIGEIHPAPRSGAEGGDGPSRFGLE